MFEYPRRGSWAIGFITGQTEGEVQDTTRDEVVNVFLPTTPNPTSGYVFVVDEHEVRYLDMSVDEAVKFVISLGTVDGIGDKIKQKNRRGVQHDDK